MSVRLRRVTKIQTVLADAARGASTASVERLLCAPLASVRGDAGLYVMSQPPKVSACCNVCGGSRAVCFVRAGEKDVSCALVETKYQIFASPI
jgi:hypothetical protein